MHGDLPAKNTVCTPYIPINVWFWPTLFIYAHWGSSQCRVLPFHTLNIKQRVSAFRRHAWCGPRGLKKSAAAVIVGKWLSLLLVGGVVHTHTQTHTHTHTCTRRHKAHTHMHTHTHTRTHTHLYTRTQVGGLAGACGSLVGVGGGVIISPIIGAACR